MMNNLITLDYQSRVPIYEQIIKEFEKYIALGILKENDQIPSIRELASTLGINPNTVRKAYERLEQLGIITTISTKGTLVTDSSSIAIESKIADSLVKINSLIKELEQLGITKEEIIKKLK